MARAMAVVWVLWVEVPQLFRRRLPCKLGAEMDAGGSRRWGLVVRRSCPLHRRSREQAVRRRAVAGWVDR
jgi:hypothetical protein